MSRPVSYTITVSQVVKARQTQSLMTVACNLFENYSSFIENHYIITKLEICLFNFYEEDLRDLINEMLQLSEVERDL